MPGIIRELKRVLRFRVVLPVILLSAFFFTQFLLAPRKILMPVFGNHCVSPWDFECFAELVEEFGNTVTKDDLARLAEIKKEQYAIMGQNPETRTEYQKAEGMAACIEWMEEKIKTETGYTRKEAEEEYKKDHGSGFYTGIYRHYYEKNLMKTEVSLLETTGDYTVNDLAYLSVWIQAGVFVILLAYWKQKDNTANKKSRIYAGVLGCVLVSVFLLIAYLLCGIRLGFLDFKDCPMEYRIPYFILPYWAYALLLNLWTLVFTAGHAVAASLLLSRQKHNSKAVWVCAATSAVFAVATCLSCGNFLFVTEKIPIVCPETAYILLLGIAVKTVVKKFSGS